jgi:hypothetical protein
MGGAVEHELEGARKIAAGECLVCDRKAVDYEDRQMVLVLDNSSSKLRNKTVAYRVTIGSPEAICELRVAYAKLDEDYAAAQVNRNPIPIPNPYLNPVPNPYLNPIPNPDLTPVRA